MGEEHRVKIANSNILKYLINHVEGTKELSSTQVTVALALLKKVMPDLQSVAMTNETHDGPGKLVIEMICDSSKFNDI